MVLRSKNLHLRSVEKVMVETYFQELREYVHYFGWNNNKRRENIPVQRETSSVTLRVASKKCVRISDRASFHTQFSVGTSAVSYFPNLMRFLYQFAERKESTLSRAIVVLLPPEAEVYPHIDFGEYYDLRSRYHLVLSSSGSTMISGSEEETFTTGDLFYFDNHVLHAAKNVTKEERIHVIFDLLPKKNIMRMKLFFSCIKTYCYNLISLFSFALQMKNQNKR